MNFIRLVKCLVFCTLACGWLYAQTQKAGAEDQTDVYSPGGDVLPPKIIHSVEPEFSGKSDHAYVEGVVKLVAVVKADGTPSDVRITKGLNDEEDKLAVEALKKWSFKPGTKKGKPVNVKVNVEIDFHLL